jgi:DNA polymerase III subunit beta
MRLSCLQENLNRGLSVVGRAVATRTTLPITNNILLATEGSRLKLAATNLEIAITCWIGAMVEEEGSITLPARLFTEYVNALPNDKVDLVMSPSSQSLQLKCARYEARISGIAADDFPPIPQVTAGITANVDPEALRESISHVVFAAATEDTRPVLTGVHTEFDGSQLTLASADGFRLAVYHTSLAKPVSDKVGVIIPARTYNEVNRLIGDQEEPIEISINAQRSQVLFRLKSAEIVSQIIQGTFPNYSQLIPQGSTTRAAVDIGDFLKVTKTASIFARDGSGIVRLQIVRGQDSTPGRMTVSARAEEIGDNMGDIDATVDGEAVKIAFNGKYLTDVLGVLQDGQMVLEATSPSSPGVIRPLGSQNYTYVVMPMFVQW